MPRTPGSKRTRYSLDLSQVWDGTPITLADYLNGKPTMNEPKPFRVQRNYTLQVSRESETRQNWSGTSAV